MLKQTVCYNGLSYSLKAETSSVLKITAGPCLDVLFCHIILILKLFLKKFVTPKEPQVLIRNKKLLRPIYHNLSEKALL